MGGGPPEFTPDFTWPALLGKTSRVFVPFVYRTITFYGSLFQSDSARKNFCNSLTGLQPDLTSPTTPSSKRMQTSMNSVWAGSRSLAATEEVEVSFRSRGYLDVSVHLVASFNVWIRLKVSCLQQDRFPHSEISGSKLA